MIGFALGRLCTSPVYDPVSVTPPVLLVKPKEAVEAPPKVLHSQAIKPADSSQMDQMRPKRDRKKPDWYGDRA